VSQVRVSVNGLKKRYRIGETVDLHARLTESLWGAIRSPAKSLRRRQGSGGHFWALNGVSLEVHEGEVVGIIGRNGAGKTTLLKILSRITEPTEGTAKIVGRVSSLLEVGTGFHPDLTGRENIFLNGAILGMRRSETLRKFDQIVAFAEVQNFLDTPVKRYSSGMHVRLAFAVAAHLEPEILIVDEVLSVGDAAFQKKCLGKIGEVSYEGRTVLFVSHNMAAVENLCSRGVLLKEGQVAFEGNIHETVEEYLMESSPGSAVSFGGRRDRKGSGKVRLLEFVPEMKCGSPGCLRFRFEAKEDVQNVAVSIGIFGVRGEGVAYLANGLSGNEFKRIPREGWINCNFTQVPVLPGTYMINVYCSVNGVVADWIVDAATFRVSEGDFYSSGKMPPPGYGSIALRSDWCVESI